MRQIYTDPKNPASYSSIANTLREVRKQFPKAKRSEVKEILRGVDAYTLHKPVRHRFRQVKTHFESWRSHLWADLCDVQKISAHNDGVRFLLVVQCGYSRFLWVEPLLNKKPESVLAALKKIIVGFKPNVFVCDEGTEFRGVVKEFLEDNGVKISHPHSPHKAYRAERAIRTLRARMHRHFTHTGKWRFINVLQDIVRGLNETPHSVTKIPPAQVDYKTLIHTQSGKPDGAEKAKIGDFVRLSHTRGPFHKGFYAGWTDQIYKIALVTSSTPPMYAVEDLRGEALEGRFSGHEIQIIKKPDTYRVEYILGYKTINKKKYALVKWLGYDESFNSYEPVENIINLEDSQ